MVVADLDEPRQARSPEDRPIRAERVEHAARRHEHDDAADEKREQNGEQRREESARLLKHAVALGGALGRLDAGLLRELANLLAQATCSFCVPPVIASPSSSSVAVGGNSPTSSPS